MGDAGADARQARAERFLTVLRALAALAVAYLVWPVVPELLFGAVLAATGAPLFERLARRLRGHRELAAMTFTAMFALLVLVPVVAAVVSAVGEAVEAAHALGALLEERGVAGLVAFLPEALRTRFEGIVLDQGAMQEHIAALLGRALAFARAAVRLTSNAIFSTAMMLIACVVFLADGARVVRWLDEVIPLPRGQVTELLRAFRDVGVAVVVGNFGTSAAQAATALVGYLISGVPSPLLLTLTTFILSFVPSVGGAGTTLVVAGGLALAGSSGRALFLALWAVAAVGVVDNVVKPLLVKRGLKLHGAVVFFSLVAGIVAFGPAGLLLGPLIVTFALTLLRFDARTTRRTAGGRRTWGLRRRRAAGSGAVVGPVGAGGSGTGGSGAPLEGRACSTPRGSTTTR